MLGANSFYKSTKMAPYTRPKRAANPMNPAPPAPANSYPKSKKLKTGQEPKPGASSPDVKPTLLLPNARRSPRIAQKVRVSLAELQLRSETSRSIKEEEEDEEEDDVKALKREPESDESDAEAEGGVSMSEYERRRLENISKNAEFFASLNIFQAKENLTALSPQVLRQKTIRRGLKSQKVSSEPLPRRPPSLRLQNKNPEGSELPERFKEPPLYSLYLPQPAAHERKPAGPLNMVATNVKRVEKTDQGVDFVKGLARLAKGATASITVDDTDLDRFVNRLQKMKMNESCMAKVVPDRIFSVAVHPTCEKTIVVAGDKWGKIGLWDVDSTEGEDGVFLFEPHSRPVNCLRFAPHNPTKLYSVSYDGTVKCGDFTKAVFDEVYATDEEYDRWTNYFDFLSADASSLLVTQNEGQGYVAVVDTRTRRKSAENVYWVHAKRTRSVSVHPTMPSYFVTSSADSTAALWDIRKMKTTGTNQPIAKMQHSKTVSSAFFSPLTGSQILTTSMDDKISIFDTESAKEGKLTGLKKTLWQSHNNHTGRWLTVFRATWHPRREDAFVVGSMSQPRRIEIFNTKGKLIHSFFDDYLGSVCSLNAFHPTRDVMVGGNSSGKLHVIMA